MRRNLRDVLEVQNKLIEIVLQVNSTYSDERIERRGFVGTQSLHYKCTNHQYFSQYAQHSFLFGTTLNGTKCLSTFHFRHRNIMEPSSISISAQGPEHRPHELSLSPFGTPMIYPTRYDSNSSVLTPETTEEEYFQYSLLDEYYYSFNECRALFEQDKKQKLHSLFARLHNYECVLDYTEEQYSAVLELIDKTKQSLIR